MMPAREGGLYHVRTTIGWTAGLYYDASGTWDVLGWREDTYRDDDLAEIGPRIEPPTAPAQPQAERTVRVRIAVAVTRTGHYVAHGREGYHDEMLEANLRGLLSKSRDSARISFIEADVPLPPTPTTITGEVSE